ncbi:hypothetical protein KY290_036688 [Solanum tuberosum]|uniref:Uncharacterized protein n=1 Tax=Solanum tuberosum TaxID=4113 RepID=A0ABQ7TU53_SOLTU|nr:hypothetical protein KY285_036007 [Solanum tuberosum]KAH0737983.1 hypothetical protein KY290_036688 [Solanum tuberosum]
MRKMDYGKSVHVEDDSPIPSIMGPFTSLANKILLPQREFDASLSDQRKQKPQLVNLEKAYASLVELHGELSISHGKMKKQEKNQDKFFTRMWNGVKCLWKLLKANEPLPTSRSDVDGDELVTWSDDDRMRITRPPRLMERIDVTTQGYPLDVTRNLRPREASYKPLSIS